MSCPKTSKSAQKRKRQSPDCKKPASKKMAWNSFNSIKDFGYKFNEEGCLVDIESGSGFNFEVSDDHWYNQQNYEMLGDVITEHIYELLQSDEVGLKRIEIPLNKESAILFFANKKKSKDSVKGFIFASEDINEKEKLLVLVNGSGAVKAGQWARRLIINDCLDHGTQIPYIKKAIKDGYGVVVLNTNQNEVFVEIKGKKTRKTIKESETPEKHFSYVWKNIIEKTKASKIFVVAHSYGGYLVVNYFERAPKILERVVAVGFTDSVHSLNFRSHAKVRNWLLKNSVNWVTSSADIDTPMSRQDHAEHITRVSAGTTTHEETSWKAMESIFKYFQTQEIDFGKQNEIKDGDTSGAGKKNPSKDKANKRNLDIGSRNDDDQITKKLNNEGSQLNDIACTISREPGGSSKLNERNEDTENEGEPSNSPECTSKDQLQKVVVPSKDTSNIGKTTTNADERTKPDESNENADENEERDAVKSATENNKNANENKDTYESDDDQLQKAVDTSKDTSDIGKTTINAGEPTKPDENNENAGKNEETDAVKKATENNKNANENKDALESVDDRPQKVVVVSKDTRDIGKTTTNADQPTKPGENNENAGKNQETDAVKKASENNKNAAENEAISSNSCNTREKQSEDITEGQQSEENTKTNKNDATFDVLESVKGKAEDRVSKDSSFKQNDRSSSSGEKHEEITQVQKTGPVQQPSTKEDNVDTKSNEVKTTNDTGGNDDRSALDNGINGGPTSDTNDTG